MIMSAIIEGDLIPLKKSMCSLVAIDTTGVVFNDNG